MITIIDVCGAATMRLKSNPSPGAMVPQVLFSRLFYLGSMLEYSVSAELTLPTVRCATISTRGIRGTGYNPVHRN